MPDTHVFNERYHTSQTARRLLDVLVKKSMVSQLDADDLMRLIQRFLQSSSLRQAEKGRDEVRGRFLVAVDAIVGNSSSSASEATLLFNRSVGAYILERPANVCLYALKGVDTSSGLGPVIEGDNRRFKEALKDAAMGAMDIIVHKDCQNRAEDVLRTVRGIEHQKENIYNMVNQLLANIKTAKLTHSPSTISVFARRRSSDSRNNKQKHIQDEGGGVRRSHSPGPFGWFQYFRGY
jgi:hypothetical protein